MKIRPVGAELFHDGRTDMTKLFAILQTHPKSICILWKLFLYSCSL